jgi:curved DNA-binding protein CbpA
MSLLEQNHYERLGLEENASLDEIRQAYRERAAVCHPDVRHFANSSDAENIEVIRTYETMFKLISDAYLTLKDEKKRKAYDSSLSRGRNMPKHFTAKKKNLPVRVSIIN